MPELPEVETVARQLKPRIVGRKLVSISIRDEKLQHLRRSGMRGMVVRDVRRLGKQVVLSLGTGSSESFVAVHLRMTGRLFVADTAGEFRKLTQERHRVAFTFDSGGMVFSDTRRFGTIQVASEESAFYPAGIEPLSRECTARKLVALAGMSKQPIKTWLLRQDRIVGLGNIYASEILFAARIHPERAVAALGPEEWQALVREMKRILRKAIANCGTTFSDFQTTVGSVGNFQQYLKVYGREGESCLRCETTIQRVVHGGRSTFWCPSCQSSTAR